MSVHNVKCLQQQLSVSNNDADGAALPLADWRRGVCPCSGMMGELYGAGGVARFEASLDSVQDCKGKREKN